MNEIVRRNPVGPGSGLARVDRATGRALSAVRSDAIIAEAQEMVAERLAQLRIEGGTRLAGRAVSQLTMLSALVTQLVNGNPGLELELRQIEGIVAAGTASVIVNYMGRSL